MERKPEELDKEACRPFGWECSGVSLPKRSSSTKLLVMVIGGSSRLIPSNHKATQKLVPR